MIPPATSSSIGGIYLAGILGGGPATNPVPPDGFITAAMLQDSYALAGALTAETTRAQTAEAALVTQMNQAVNAAIQASNSGITSEANARVSADAAINTALKALTVSVGNTATNVGQFYAELSASIAAEASTRSTADASLNASIGNVQTALTAEIARATGAETGRLVISKNLSDLASLVTARANLGLGSAAQRSQSDFDAAGAAATVNTALTAEVSRAQVAEATKLSKSSNLSDLPNAGTARTNLGLNSAATHATSDFEPTGSVATERTRAETAEALLAPLSDTVLLDTDQTVTGDKNFTGDLTVSGEAVVVNNDSRLSDARNPLPGSVINSSISNATIAGTKIAANAAIALTQLSSGVQASIALANSAVQSVNGHTGSSVTVTSSDVEAIPTSIVTAKGDLIVGSDTIEPIIFGIGEDGSVLTADSTSDFGMSWKTAMSMGDHSRLAETPPAGTPVVHAVPFTFNTADLLTGYSVYTPKVGEVLLDVWFNVSEAWDGTTPVADVFVDLSKEGLFAIDLIQDGTAVDLLRSVFTSTTPLSLVVSSDGTPSGSDPGATQGVATLYFTTAVPAT